jgi:hypothetical protein
MLLKTLTGLAIALSFSSMSSAAIVTLTPSDIHGNDSTTALFSNGEVTLTPFILDETGAPAAATFNDNVNRIGIDDNNTGQAFNDADTIVGNEGDELLVFDFVATSGLTQIAYDFSRADGPGPDDGVRISGFLANPNITFSGSTNAALTATYDAGSGSVLLNVPGTLFGGADTFVNFDPTTSAGQTLTLTVNDTTQANAQFSIIGISYDNDTVAIPEPSSLAALSLVGLGVASRRKRSA